MRLLTILAILQLLLACTSMTKVPHIKLEILSGAVTGQVLQDSPIDTELHVFLYENTSDQSRGKVISCQHIELSKGNQFIPFTIEYKASDTRQDKAYSVQACTTRSGAVTYLAKQSVTVMLYNQQEPLLIQIEVMPKLAGVDTLNIDAKTTLQRGIQTILIELCQQKTGVYDDINRIKATDILPAQWLEGPHHKVREQVTLRGPHYFFIVDSDYGVFSVQSLALLKKLLDEFTAIAELKKLTRSRKYFEITKESSLIPFIEVKQLLLHPVDTLAGIPKGLHRFFSTLPVSLTAGRSQYEDDYLAALITVSKYKRRYAAELGVDVYSDNPMLQYELNRLCWSAALGNWTPSIILLPFSGPGILAYSSFGLSETLNRLIEEEGPDFLRYENNRVLKAMGIEKVLRQQFLSHPYYSPRMLTIIVAALDKMNNVQGRELFLQQAVLADSLIDAFTFQQIAELLLEYHINISPFSEIILYQQFPVAYSVDKTLVIAFPVDIFRWTPFSERMLNHIKTDLISERDIKNKIFRVSGQLTERSKHHLYDLGIQFTEQVEITPY